MPHKKTQKNENQPNIRINSILLVDSYFKRVPKIPKELKIDIKIKVTNKLLDDDKTLVCQVDFNLFTIEDKDVEVKCTFIGLFNQSKPGNILLKDFANYNAPAMIYPYIREYISNLIIRAQLPPLFLPPMNFTAILKKAEISS